MEKIKKLFNVEKINRFNIVGLLIYYNRKEKLISFLLDADDFEIKRDFFFLRDIEKMNEFLDCFTTSG